MRTGAVLSLLLLVWLAALSIASCQTPYGGMQESATQYQHRWTDELEFAMMHQRTQPDERQQPNTAFIAQQAAETPHPRDTRQPHSFAPVPATAELRQPQPNGRNGEQQHVTIPLSDIVIHSATSAADSVFDTAAVDTTAADIAAAADVEVQDFPFNSSVVKRVRAACSLSCSERLMDVTGEGRVRINSTRALIRATVEYKEQLTTAVLASASTAATLHALLLFASNQTANTSAAVIAYLQSDELAGRLWHLHTTSLLVEPIYQYANGTQLTTGYRASLSLSLQAATSNASDVLAGMLARGVTRIDSVGYEAADADMATARHKAVRRAVEDALRQATTAVQGVQSTLRELQHSNKAVEYSSDELQVVSMRVTGVSVPMAQVYYPSQTRIFGLSRSASQPFVDESVMSIPIIAEDKIITATVQMKVRY